MRTAVQMIAILRGLTPQRASEVGAALFEAGFRSIEIPLNSPQPLESIELLARAHGADCLVGAGTVGVVVRMASSIPTSAGLTRW